MLYKWKEIIEAWEIPKEANKEVLKTPTNATKLRKYTGASALTSTKLKNRILYFQLTYIYCL